MHRQHSSLHLLLQSTLGISTVQAKIHNSNKSNQSDFAASHRKSDQRPNLMLLLLNLARLDLAILSFAVGLSCLEVMDIVPLFVTHLQADYHSLIGITADLVDALEATVQGRPVSSLPSCNKQAELRVCVCVCVL